MAAMISPEYEWLSARLQLDDMGYDMNFQRLHNNISKIKKRKILNIYNDTNNNMRRNAKFAVFHPYR